MKMKIVERKIGLGIYNIPTSIIIIDHPKHGRLLVSKGFSGMDSLEGGTYRWRHGIVAQLKDDDTLDSLTTDWNMWLSVIQAVIEGYDPDRPLLPWPGYMIEKMMMAADQD